MRIFNEIGERKYQEWVQRFCAKETKGQGPVPFELLQDDATSVDLGTSTPDQNHPCPNKYELISYLRPFIDECLAKLATQKMDEQRRVWDAFALFFFDTICPKDETGAYSPNMFAHYMIDDQGINLRPHYQRHRIYDPYRFVVTNCQAIRLFFEADLPNECGNLEEDFGGRQEYVSNATLLSLLNHLYVGNDGKPISGYFAAAKQVEGTKVKQCKPGSLRRLTAAIKQLKCNFDVLQCSVDEMMNVLPAEFAIWHASYHARS